MIQRIQTIWLILAATCMALTLKYAFYSGNVVTTVGNTPQSNFKELTAATNIVNLLIAITFIVGAVICIFLFKKRKQQLIVAAVLILLGLVNLFLLWNGTKAFQNGNYGIAAVLPVFAIGFSVSAWRGIYSDKKKIDELNSSRLR